MTKQEQIEFFIAICGLFVAGYVTLYFCKLIMEVA